MSSRRSIGNTFHVTTVTDGTNGTNAFSVDLSNEMDSVACDNDMKTAAAFNIYSQIAAFYGVKDVTALCQIRYTSKPTNASLTLETSGSGTGSTSLTTTFQTISTKQWIRIHYNSGVAVSKRETLEVEINHATYGTIALSIAVVGMKGGAIYNLVPSANAITHKKDGTYTPNVITCGSSKLDVATGTTSSNPSEATIKYSADGGSVTNYPSGGLTAGTNFTNYVTFFLYVNNTVVDKETVNIVTDGTNGTNGSDGKDGKDGAEGYGLKLTLERSGRYSESSWNTWGTIGRSEPWGKIDGDSDFTACRVGDYFIVTGTSTDKGIRHTEQFRCTSVSANSIIGTCVSHVKDGQEGSRGRIGRFFYYVGTWTGDTVKTYIVNDAQAPYFKYGSNYFVFNPETNGNYTESQMGTPSTSSSNWDIMTNDFKYIITAALFSSFANLGSFIISEDWLISQNGTVNGSSSGAYTQFDKDYPNTNHYNSSTGRYNFIPNVAINGETGEVYMNSAFLRGQIVGVTGSFKSLDCVNSDGVKIGRICANTGAYGGVAFETVDIIHQGQVNGRSGRFLSSDIWCRGSFGHRGLNTAVVSQATIKYYTEGLTESYYASKTMTSHTSDGRTYYDIDLYSGTSGDASGFPVDLVIINNSYEGYSYRLVGMASKKVSVICSNDYHGVDIAFIAGWLGMSGGEVREFINVGNNYSPTNTNVGAGWFALEGCDNTWV